MCRQRLAPVLLAEPVLAKHVGLACHQRLERVEPQPVVVVEVFVTKSQRPDDAKARSLGARPGTAAVTVMMA